MTSALERTLFLLAESRLLLLEIQDVERQLQQLTSAASPPERPFLEDGLAALGEAAEAGRSALGEIEELVPAIEKQRERGREAT